MLISKKQEITQRKRSSKYPVFFPIVAALTFCLGACNTFAQVGYKDGFSQSIFLGHSFFRPGTDDIAVLAPYTGHTRHTQYLQFAGGTNGDAGSLWRRTGDNELGKAEIKKGGVELVAVAFGGDAPDNEVADYADWIDLTLQYNASTFDTFVIQSGWPSASVQTTYADNRATQDLINLEINRIVQELRVLYPDLTVLHMPVAEAMSRLWALYEQGQLGPEILGVQIIGNRANSLQTDTTGHPGDIMEDVQGLIWHQTLYPETDVRTLTNIPTYQNTWTYDIRQLAYDVWQDESYAHRYNDATIDPEPPYFYSSPIVEIGATVGTAYSGATLSDNAGDSNGDPLTFAKVSGPSWLSVAIDGTLFGAPAWVNTGLNTFTVSVSDGIYTAVEETLEITVVEQSSNNAPVFTAPPFNVSDGTADEAYSDTIAGSATDADGDPLTYSKVSGTAGWLTIASDGALSGTPNGAYIGGENVTVMVSDGNGGSDTAIMEIVVLEGGSGPVELLKDDMENFNGTGWVTDWATTTWTSHSSSTSVRGNKDSNDLESPQLDTSGKTSLTISFWYYNIRVDADDDVRIQLWNGSSYVDLEELGDDAQNTWLQFTTTLTSAQNPEYFSSNFKFKIEATSLDQYEFIAIDDVVVTVE